MSEHRLPLTKVVRLSSGELSQVQNDKTAWVMGALAGLLLIGVAYWTVVQD